MSLSVNSVWSQDSININLGPQFVCYRSVKEVVPKRLQALKVIETLYHEVCDQNQSAPGNLLLWSNEILDFGELDELRSLAWKSPMLLRASSEQFWGALNWLERPSIVLTFGGAGNIAQREIARFSTAIDGIFPIWQDELLAELHEYTKQAQHSDSQRTLVFDEGQGRFSDWNPALATLKKQEKNFYNILNPRSGLRLRQQLPQRIAHHCMEGWAAAGASLLPADSAQPGTQKRTITAWKVILDSNEVTLEIAQTLAELVEQLTQNQVLELPKINKVILSVRSLPLWSQIREDLGTRWQLSKATFGYHDLVFGWHPVASRLQLLFSRELPVLLIDIQDFPRVEVVVIR